MTSKWLSINQSERHLTRLNMPEVCLDKTIESCLKVMLLKTLQTLRKIHKMLIKARVMRIEEERTPVNILNKSLFRPH